MLGLRLRYQIAGFIFLLFSTVVLFMGYFNITILSDQLQSLSLYRAMTGAQNIFDLFMNSFSTGYDSLESFVSDKDKMTEFAKYVQSLKDVRNIEIYDSRGKKIYSRLSRDMIRFDDESQVMWTIATRKTRSVMWAVDLYSDTGVAVEKYGILDPRMILAGFYFPVMKDQDIIGVVHVSINLEKSSRLLQLFFVGNLSLSMVFILTAFVAIYMWSENAINKPIRNLLKAQERLSRGDFDVHVDLNLPSNNELSVIANSFNHMATELKVYQDKLKEQTQELKKVNLQYVSLNENLEKQVEEKTLEQREFFSLITHDLKIPLAAINGYLALLKKSRTGQLNDKQKQFINSIEAATGHLLGMVRNLLDSVKYDAGRVEYYIEEFNLRELALEVEEHLHPLTGEKNIDFSMMIPDECTMVLGDRAKIGQVLSNILSNAINYTPEKGIITLTAEREDDKVEVRVRDTGIGIQPEQLERIFDKFQQIPGKESPSTSLGLGLYIVRKIMEGHGMKVWAESAGGKGSSFYFTLKVSNMGEKRPEDEPAGEQQNKGSDS